jgi:hypothetical protein
MLVPSLLCKGQRCSMKELNHPGSVLFASRENCCSCIGKTKENV